MANSPSSKKRARQQEKRRQHNASQRSMVRTYIKKVDAEIAGGNYDNAQAAFLTAQPII
ncbi:30S ribosomal protein S20, partial [Oleiphilus sp. HI0069]